MSATKAIRQIIAEAKDAGWTIALTNGGHYQFKHPSGALVHVSATPSDPRAFKNIRGDLKRELRKRGVA